MIKVGIETRPLFNQSVFRGVGRYTNNLIKSLSKIKKVELTTGGYKEIVDKVDLIHFPYFDFYFVSLPKNVKIKSVVTIHDCIPLAFPKQFPSGIKGKVRLLIQKNSLKNINAVITDSNSSKRDIVKYLKYPEEKITTIYLSAGEIFTRLPEKQSQEVKEKYSLKDNFILYVGDINYNKNIEGLIRAFNNVGNNDSQMVLVGKAFEDNSLAEVQKIKSLINELDLSRKIKILGFVEDNELVKLYNQAGVFCMPSFYEGFGLQILEAMKCGCPVVTANISSLPEITGEAAVLINPNNINSISDAINKLLSDNVFRKKMIEKGFTQADKFSWENSVNQTIRIYEEVLAKE